MTQTWLIYARSGAEFDVERDLRAIGADAWCGRVLEGKPDPRRGGRKRLMLWDERPALPNYVFATLTGDQYHDAKAMRDVIGFVSVVIPQAERYVHAYRARVEEAHTAAKRARERGEQAPPQFRPGEALEAVGGPLIGLMARYRQVIEGPDGFEVECDTDVGRVKFNPADVRKVG